MARLILDTSILINAERGGRMANEIQPSDDLAIAAITIAELRVGVLRGSGVRGAQRQVFLRRIMETIPVIGYDTRVALKHAELLVAAAAAGRTRGAYDLIIAATAAASGRVVVTHDRSGFIDLPGISVRVLPEPA